VREDTTTSELSATVAVTAVPAVGDLIGVDVHGRGVGRRVKPRTSAVSTDRAEAPMPDTASSEAAMTPAKDAGRRVVVCTRGISSGVLRFPCRVGLGIAGSP